MEIKILVGMKAAKLISRRRNKDFQKELKDWSNIEGSIRRTLVVQQGRPHIQEQTQFASAQQQGSTTQKGAKAMKIALGKMTKRSWCQAMLKETSKDTGRSSERGSGAKPERG